MGSELHVRIVCEDHWPTDKVLAVRNEIGNELKRRTGRQHLDTGGGRGGADIWLPTEDADSDRRMIAEVIGQLAPDAIYTVKLSDD